MTEPACARARSASGCWRTGLATAAELAAMTERQLHQFIFRPGFSTAATVTAVSGRGVGMDVVKSNVERLGGIGRRAQRGRDAARP